MKVLLLLATLLLVVLHNVRSQTNAFSIEMLKLRSADDRLCTRPMNCVNKSKSILWLSKTMEISAAASYHKNTLPTIGFSNGVSRNYHISTPAFVNFQVYPNTWLETGAYIGVAASSLQAIGAGDIPFPVDRRLRLNFDSGLIAGFGMALSDRGKMSLRYNHGFSKVELFDGNQSTRRIDIGLTIKL